MHSTSTSLLIRLREPTDQLAWSRFVSLYGPLMLHWARCQGLNAEDAADLTQEVMTLLLRKLPEFSYDKSRSFRGWLKVVTLNKWREWQRRKRLPTANCTESELVHLAVQDQADEFWDGQYREQLVRRALEMIQHEFQPTTWDACRRYVLGQERPDDLAKELGISIWTIYAAKSRVMKRLREELADLLD